MQKRTFQSTPPVKAATCRLSISDYADTISIHAAREGGDVAPLQKHIKTAPFQSTPPVKAATLLIEGIVKGILFQSTPPVKAATK